MYKKYKAFFFIASLLFGLPTVLFSQKGFPDFGVFNLEEKNMKVCEFDPEADAVILIDYGKSYYDDQYNLITERRIRMKILKESAIERGNVRIVYYSGDKFEFIRDIDAVVLSYDEQQSPVLTKLDKKAVYTKQLNKYYSEISFALPKVQVGSILEYKYRSQMEHYGGLKEWVFQKDIPVMFSGYDLTIVPNAKFSYSVYRNQFMDVIVKPDSRDGRVYFQMNNVPGLRDEAFMGSRQDYLQRIRFQFAGLLGSTGQDGVRGSADTHFADSWKKLAENLIVDWDYGSLTNKNLSNTSELEAMWAGAPNDFARMRITHDYVRAKMSWDHIYSLYSEAIKNAWEKKAGNSGQINLILINLLKSANLEVYPLLVSERDHGKVDSTYPYITQFNKVVACVFIGGKQYILDGTDYETPSFMIPFDLLNTIGFLVDKKKSSLIYISDNLRKNLRIVSFTAKVDEKGLVNEDVSVSFYNYARVEKKTEYNRNKKKYQENFFSLAENAKIDSFAVSGMESDSLAFKTTTKLNYTLNKSGDYYLLHFNQFVGLNKNPFTTKQRFSEIDFGCKRSYMLSGTITLPKTLVPEALPESVNLVTPDRTMNILREIKMDGNEIKVMIRAEVNKAVYSPNEYYPIQDFFAKMVEIINEPVVLKGKN